MKWLIGLGLILLVGCSGSGISAQGLAYADTVCRPNDGLKAIVVYDGWAKVFCNNHAVFEIAPPHPLTDGRGWRTLP